LKLSILGLLENSGRTKILRTLPKEESENFLRKFKVIESELNHVILWGLLKKTDILGLDTNFIFSSFKSEGSKVTS